MDYENTFTDQVDYDALMDQARKEYDSFTVVWRAGFKFSDKAKSLDQQLEPFLISQKKANKWPGTEASGPPSIVKEYSVCKQSIEILREAGSAWAWVSPDRPEDLAFYKKGNVVFASVAHERMAWHEKP